jgi:hypothetical protein
VRGRTNPRKPCALLPSCAAAVQQRFSDNLATNSIQTFLTNVSGRDATNAAPSNPARNPRQVRYASAFLDSLKVSVLHFSSKRPNIPSKTIPADRSRERDRRRQASATSDVGYVVRCPRLSFKLQEKVLCSRKQSEHEPADVESGNAGHGAGMSPLKCGECEWLSRSLSRPMHPAWLRCSSVTYEQYASSSRLASRAPGPRSATDLAIRGPLAQISFRLERTSNGEPIGLPSTRQ